MNKVYLLQVPAGHETGMPHVSTIEAYIMEGVQSLKLFIETIGALIIALGVFLALFHFVRALFPPQVESYNKIRLILARYLALALEFQLGADILATAVAPSWDQIGKLGAIAIIRTALNYFLSMEMKSEQRALSDDRQHESLVPEVQAKKGEDSR